MDQIIEFRKEYYFLSNFYLSPIEYKGRKYRCAEAAFQAQKCTDENYQERMTKLNGKEARALGKKVMIRHDWGNIRLKIMYEIVQCKFGQAPKLAEKLAETEGMELIEVNTWNDHYWGVCDGKGHNWLGKCLMQVRKEIKT